MQELAYEKRYSKLLEEKLALYEHTLVRERELSAAQSAMQMLKAQLRDQAIFIKRQVERLQVSERYHKEQQALIISLRKELDEKTRILEDLDSKCKQPAAMNALQQQLNILREQLEENKRVEIQKFNQQAHEIKDKSDLIELLKAKIREQEDELITLRASVKIAPEMPQSTQLDNALAQEKIKEHWKKRRRESFAVNYGASQNYNWQYKGTVEPQPSAETIIVENTLNSGQERIKRIKIKRQRMSEITSKHDATEIDANKEQNDKELPDLDVENKSLNSNQDTFSPSESISEKRQNSNDDCPLIVSTTEPFENKASDSQKATEEDASTKVDQVTHIIAEKDPKNEQKDVISERPTIKITFGGQRDKKPADSALGEKGHSSRPNSAKDSNSSKMPDVENHRNRTDSEDTPLRVLAAERSKWSKNMQKEAPPQFENSVNSLISDYSAELNRTDKIAKEKMNDTNDIEAYDYQSIILQGYSFPRDENKIVETDNVPETPVTINELQVPMESELNNYLSISSILCDTGFQFAPVFDPEDNKTNSNQTIVQNTLETEGKSSKAVFDDYVDPEIEPFVDSTLDFLEETDEFTFDHDRLSENLNENESDERKSPVSNEIKEKDQVHDRRFSCELDYNSALQTSDKAPRKPDFVSLGFKDQKYIPWLKLISTSLFNVAQIKRLRAAIMDFLRMQVGEKYELLTALNSQSGELEPVIPEDLVLVFNSWFDEQLDNGILSVKKSPRQRLTKYSDSKDDVSEENEKNRSDGEYTNDTAKSNPRRKSLESRKLTKNNQTLAKNQAQKDKILKNIPKNVIIDKDALTSPDRTLWSTLVKLKYPKFPCKNRQVENFVNSFYRIVTNLEPPTDKRGVSIPLEYFHAFIKELEMQFLARGRPFHGTDYGISQEELRAQQQRTIESSDAKLRNHKSEINEKTIQSSSPKSLEKLQNAQGNIKSFEKVTNARLPLDHSIIWHHLVKLKYPQFQPNVAFADHFCEFFAKTTGQKHIGSKFAAQVPVNLQVDYINEFEERFVKK